MAKQFELTRRTVKSKQFTITATGQGEFQIPWDFLEPTLTGKRNPGIVNLKARIGYNVDTGGSGGPGRLLAQAAARIRLEDVVQGSPRVNLSGGEQRLINFAEKTGTYKDNADLTTGLDDSTGDHFIDLLPAQLLNEAGEHDHAILVSDLMNGGGLYWTWNIATPYAGYFTFNGATFVEIWADVVDMVTPGGDIILPPRHCYLSEGITSTDQLFVVNGLTRWMIPYKGDAAVPTNSGLSASNLYRSDSLQTPGSLSISKFIEDYRSRAYAPQASDPFLLQSDPYCFALFAPRFGQPITELPLADKIQLALDAGSWGTSGPRMVRSIYTPRSARGEVAALGASSAAEAAAHITANGRVMFSDKRVSSLPKGVAPYLPIVVPAIR